MYLDVSLQYMRLGSFIAFSCISISACTVGWIVYTRVFHPLSKVPGPWIASVSRLWVIYRLAKGDMDQVQRNLHARYGPLIRIAPNEVACADPHAIKQIYRTQNALTKTDFYPVWGNTEISKYRDHFSVVNEKLHSERRRIVSHVYSLANVLQSEHAIDRCCIVLTEKLIKLAQNGVVCDLSPWLQWYSFDTIGELFFGRRFGFLDEEKDHDKWIASLDAFMPAMCRLAVSPSYMRPLIMAVAVFDPTMKRALQCIATMSEVAKGYILDRGHYSESQTKGNSRNLEKLDLLQQLFNVMHEKGPKVDFGIQEIQQESYTAIMAGSDSTAIALRAAFYFIIRDRDIYHRVQAEVDDANKKGELSFPVKYAEALKLPLLCASIKEAMRLFPSVGLTLPRLSPAGGIALNGTFIPEGYRVGVNAAVVHFDQNIFGPDADVFRPERWLDPSKAVQMERYMLQFGGGTRTCIGKNVSLEYYYEDQGSILSTD